MVVKILELIAKDGRNSANLTTIENQALSTALKDSKNNGNEELIGTYMLEYLVKYFCGAFDIDEYFDDSLDDNQYPITNNSNNV